MLVVSSDLEPPPLVAHGKNRVIGNAGNQAKLPPLCNHQAFRRLRKIFRQIKAKRVHVRSPRPRKKPPGFHNLVAFGGRIAAACRLGSVARVYGNGESPVARTHNCCLRDNGARLEP